MILKKMLTGHESETTENHGFKEGLVHPEGESFMSHSSVMISIICHPWRVNLRKQVDMPPAPTAHGPVLESRATRLVRHEKTMAGTMVFPLKETILFEV